jgi:hypothetical protein
MRGYVSNINGGKTMRRLKLVFIAGLLILCFMPSMLYAEILAMVNYESKPDQRSRSEGIAVIDVDPESESFGKILMDIPLPHNMVNHHLYYNKDRTKAYVTALGTSTLHVMDVTRFPYRMRAIDIPQCKVLEDMTFTSDNKTWYLTCMGSQNIIMGDAETDKPLKSLPLPKPYPHGITLNEKIDRILVTSTDPPDGVGQPGETVTVIEASTGNTMSSHKMSVKPSPSGAAPVEVHFIPNSSPPAVYVTNIFGGTLWYGVWDAEKKDFEFNQAFDFTKMELGVPLVIEFNDRVDRLYVTTGKPGHMNIFNIGENPKYPEFMKSVPAAEGAHHVVFSPDRRYAFVQNNLLNMEGLSDGSITVIDMTIAEPVASVDTLKNRGLNPNCIVLLPEWSTGHGH